MINETAEEESESIFMELWQPIFIDIAERD